MELSDCDAAETLRDCYMPVMPTARHTLIFHTLVLTSFPMSAMLLTYSSRLDSRV